MLAVAAMAFTACTTDITDDVVKNETVEYTVPLEFVAEQEVSRAFMTDDINIQFEAGDEFGVYVTPADASAAKTLNAKFTAVRKNGVLVVSGDVASFATGDKVMAYYPYSTLNDKKEASAVTLQIKEVQVQQTLGQLSCKNMAMVSVATELESAAGGKLYFRPVASIMKLNIYSSNADQQGKTIRRVRFNSEKHEDTTGINYMVGNYNGFDLTTVTEDSDITLNRANIARSTTTDANIPYACYAFADYNEDGVTVAASSNDATPVYVVLFPGNYGGKHHSGTAYSKILIYTEELGRFDIEVKDIYEFGRAMVRPFSIDINNVTPKVGIGVEYIHKYAVDYAKVLSGEATKGSVADQLFDEELIVIASGTECSNAQQPLQKDWKTVNCAENDRTFYAQTLDGAHGFRFEYYSVTENKLKRGDKIKMTCGSLQWFKVKAGVDAEGKDIWEYFATSFSPSNIFKLTSGCQDEIVTKEKHINELTGADINTDVKLLDMEFLVKDAAYVMGFASGAMTDVTDNLHGEALALRGQFATMMQDKNDDAIYVLINSACSWARDLTKGTVQVPQGVGSVHGVLVHNSEDKSYSNLGKFQLRPYDQTSFNMGTTKADAVTKHAAWYLNQYSVSIGKYAWNGNSGVGGYKIGASNAITTLEQNKLHATVGLTNGSAVLYSTNLKAFAKHNGGLGATKTSANFANWQYHPDIRDGFKAIKTIDCKKKDSAGNYVAASLPNADNSAASKASCLAYRNDVASYYGWNEDGSWDGTTTGIMVEFPGASKQMSISFSMGSMHSSKTDNAYVMTDLRDRALCIGFPLYWKVECSIDGGNSWTRCTCALTGKDHFMQNPTMHYFGGTNNYYTDANKTIDTTGKNTPLEHCPGFLQQKFVLPESAIGAAKVMVKISPASLRLAGFGAKITDSIDTGVDCTKDYYYVHDLALEDVAVTCAK